jgi:hypothetical protein
MFSLHQMRHTCHYQSYLSITVLFAAFMKFVLQKDYYESCTAGGGNSRVNSERLVFDRAGSGTRAPHGKGSLGGVSTRLRFRRNCSCRFIEESLSRLQVLLPR